MEPMSVRDQVHDFTKACQALADFAHHHRLTEQERLRVVSFVRALELEVQPPVPLLSPDNSPVAATLSNISPID
jgi:hypothetical protein